MILRGVRKEGRVLISRFSGAPRPGKGVRGIFFAGLLSSRVAAAGEALRRERSVVGVLSDRAGWVLTGKKAKRSEKK